VELPITILVQKGLDLGGGFIPALLEGSFADVLGNGHVGGIKFAVAYDLDFRNAGDFLANEFKNGTAEIAGDATVGFCAREFLGEERVIKPLAAGGEAMDRTRHFDVTASFSL
jgi:hypothetical protein